MKIAIPDDYQYIIRQLDCFALLHGLPVQVLHHTEKDIQKLAAQLHDTEILVLTRERTAITSELLYHLPRLRLISQTGKISNHLDLEACTRHGVAVAEGIGSPVAPAELAWALLMNTLRKIPQAIEGFKQGKWQVNIGTTVAGKTIGIWGYGKIGQRMAGYAKAFGANVLVWGSQASRGKAVADGFAQAPDQDTFFKTADVVTLHLRLSEKTKGIVRESDLRSMKDHACIINTARAELIEPGALLRVLQSGQPLLAGLDVYEEEPLYDKNHPLLHMPNVVCTPHLGYVEKNGYELYFGKAFENAVSFIKGMPVNIVNPEVIRL